MISISAAVNIILYLVIAAVIFGLLWWLLDLIAGLFPGPPGQLFLKIGRVILAVLAVLVVIGVLLSLVGDRPLFRP